MAKIYFLIGLLVVSVPGALLAQRIDYNTIILPADAREVSFEEKLVRLAWQNHPANSTLENHLNIADTEIKLAKRNWLNRFNVTGNLNEFTINPNTLQDVPVFFPRYNISATLSIGMFANEPLEVRVRKEQKEIALKDINTKKLALRAEVLRKYQAYLTSEKIFNLRKGALVVAEDAFKSLETAVKKGEGTIQNYDKVTEDLNALRVQTIVAEGDFKLAKIDLEELIGVRLEDVH